MPHLVETLKKSLRPGDAVAQFSDSQYVILLSACTYEGGMLVANRIISKFYQDNKIYRNLKIKINIEKVKTTENIFKANTADEIFGRENSRSKGKSKGGLYEICIHCKKVLAFLLCLTLLTSM